jgi:spore germination protein YaaH
MEVEYQNRRSKERGKRVVTKWMITLLVTFLFSSGIIGFLLYNETKPKPSLERVKPYPAPAQVEGNGLIYPLIYKGKLQNEQILVQEDEMYVDVKFLQREMDPTVIYEEESQSLIWTTQDQVLTLRNSTLTDEIKGEKVELQFPLTLIEGTIYVPITPFKKLLPYDVVLHENGEVVEVVSKQLPILHGEIIKKEADLDKVEEEEEIQTFFLRAGTSDQEPYITTLEPGSEVIIFEEIEAWYYVQADGFLGYIPKESLKIKEINTPTWEKEVKSFTPWNPIGDKINLTWEHVIRRTPDPSQIPPLPGVNVISPTWFHLKDNEGGLKNIADTNYVRWAHRNGYQVWALVTNDFNPDLTHEVLSSYEKRKNIILQLLYYAELYDLDGYNVDFENVYLKDKENVVQFMRELTPYLHEQRLVVSIDVTIKSNSEMWSLFLDRPALGQIVDYMMVMTYDEHWGSSPVAGSVASLSWVERGLRGVLAEVPNEKLLLGVPYYTRLWKEELVDGKTKVTSRAYSMQGITNWLEERQVEISYDEASGQNYAEYFDDEEKVWYKVWIEDEMSMQKRMNLVLKYDLAGVASWRRGFEKPAIWEVIEQELNKRPN